MAKYSDKLVNKIVALIEEDNYTITEICRILGVSRMAFYRWKEEKADFAEAIKNAMEFRDEKMRQKARKVIQQKLEGYRKVETKKTYIKSKNSADEEDYVLKEYVVKEKYCVPETSAVALALSDSKVGKDRVDNSQSGVSGNILSSLNVVVKDQATKDQLGLLLEKLLAE